MSRKNGPARGDGPEIVINGDRVPSSAEEWESLAEKLCHLTWTQERLQQEWGFWDKKTRDLYLVCRAELVECGVKDRLLIARLSAQEALLGRLRRGGALTSYVSNERCRVMMLPLNASAAKDRPSLPDPHVQTSLIGADPNPPKRGAKARSRLKDLANAAGGEKRSTTKPRRTTRTGGRK